MTAFSGSALFVQWIWSGGTLQMDTDFRKFDYTPGIEFFEETAGAAVNKEYLTSYKTGQASFSGVLQSGSMPLYGSALKEGNLGTLYWAPEGTALGKYHGTAAFYSQGLKQSQVYNNIVEISCDWMQTGARSEGTA